MPDRINNEQNDKVSLLVCFCKDNFLVISSIEILADEQERILNEKITLRNQWQQQADERQRQIKAEKEAEAIAEAEMNKPTTMKTIIGSRLATPYADLVDSVR